MAQSSYSEVTGFTLTEKLQEQKRFFCENCKREVFLAQKYCDGCGGQIEWPEKYEKLHEIKITTPAVPQDAPKRYPYTTSGAQPRQKRWFSLRR